MAQWNLGNFRENIHSIARTQYFMVNIPQAGTADVLTALARSTSLPQMSHETGDVWYRGLAMKLDMKPTFEPWSVKFLCDEPNSLRNIFSKWMSESYSITSLQNKEHKIYKKDGLSVSQLSTKGEIANTYTFYGAWPTTVGQVELSQESANVMEFEVTFTYDYWLQNSPRGEVRAGVGTVDIDVGANGVMNGISVRGVAGVSLNLGNR